MYSSGHLPWVSYDVGREALRSLRTNWKVTVAGLRDNGSLLTQGSKFKSPAFMNIPGDNGSPSVTLELRRQREAVDAQSRLAGQTSPVSKL